MQISKFSKTSLVLLVLWSFGLVGLSAQPSLAYPEYAVDAYTVLLDHFNGSTLANYSGGSPTYESSVAGFGQAVNLSTGSYLRYDLSSWNSAAGGTIEAWVNPTQNQNAWLTTMQWYLAYSSPPAGHIGAFGLLEGELCASVWASGTLYGDATIPVDQWSHIALTWGPSGSKFYVNGQLDAQTTSNLYPHMANPLYVYINGWGQTGFGAIDELRISNIVRTEFNTTPVPEPATMLLLASGLVGLAGFRRKTRKS